MAKYFFNTFILCFGKLDKSHNISDATKLNQCSITNSLKERGYQAHPLAVLAVVTASYTLANCFETLA